MKYFCLSSECQGERRLWIIPSKNVTVFVCARNHRRLVDERMTMTMSAFVRSIGDTVGASSTQYLIDSIQMYLHVSLTDPCMYSKQIRGKRKRIWWKTWQKKMNEKISFLQKKIWKKRTQFRQSEKWTEETNKEETKRFTLTQFELENYERTNTLLDDNKVTKHTKTIQSVDGRSAPTNDRAHKKALTKSNTRAPTQC